jgi:phytoene/squalene synthetase
MKSIFDEVSLECSKITTKAYSTSFTLGILFLNKRLRAPIYSIYGFVRLADEIVDSFHDYDKASLFASFRQATDEALQQKISLNPVLNSFQAAVHRYQVRKEWIYTFLDSMEMDLHKHRYSEEEYKKYIFGSAEAGRVDVPARVFRG